MSHATYELLDDGTFYGEVPPLAGVYANANTLEACREELAEVLEGWVAALSPVSRQDFVRKRRQLGFDGPFAGGRHEYLVRGQVRVRVPNPHEGDIGADLLTEFFGRPELAVTSGSRTESR